MKNILKRNQPPFTEKFEAKYSIPMAWGNFHVTDQADASYGLVPLHENQSAGSESQQQDIEGLGIQTTVWLLGPAEMNKFVPSFSDDPAEATSKVLPIAKDDKLDVMCGFSHGDHDLIEEYKRELVEEYEEDEEITHQEIITAVHQDMSHMLTEQLEGSLAAPTQLLLASDANKNILTFLKGYGLINMVGGIAIAGSQIGIQGEITASGEIAIGAMLVGSASIGYPGLKKILTYTNRLTVANNFFADEFASKVAEDIHQAYCTDQFDYRMSKLLGIEPDED